MSGSDYLKLGDWNATCFRCGSKRKATGMRRQWQGYYVCPEHWEPRHPQDFVRGAPDNPSVPWSQPENLTYVGPAQALCTVPGRSGISGNAVSGCSTPSTLNTGAYA